MQKGIRSTAKQFLAKQVMPVSGKTLSPPARPLREATYRR